jgi:hypothetical protein
MAKKKKIEEYYLMLPYHILNLRGLSIGEKVLLSHIYSFGDKGCWQSNETIARIYMICRRTVSIWLANLVKLELVQVKSAKGYYRTIWAKSHPKVKDAARLWYKSEQIGNPITQTSAKSSPEVGKNLHSQCAKSRIRPRKNLRTTNNTTITETNIDTIAPPSPSPRSCGAQSALEQRRLEYHRQLAHFCRNFGSGSRQVAAPTPEQLEQRRAAQLRALEPGRYTERCGFGPQTKEYKPLSDKELERRIRKQKRALLAEGKNTSKAKKTKKRKRKSSKKNTKQKKNEGPQK